MKFRNKETGEVFDGSSNAFCGHMASCESCPITKNMGSLFRDVAECIDWVLTHKEEAAELMGYELINDSSTDSSTNTSTDTSTQEAKADTGKPRPTLVPVSLMEAVTAVREYGCAKYHDPENWRRVEPQRYRDALYRHWLAYLKGENNDQESGLPHLWHLACNVAFLIEMEQEEKRNGKA